MADHTERRTTWPDPVLTALDAPKPELRTGAIVYQRCAWPNDEVWVVIGGCHERDAVRVVLQDPHDPLARDTEDWLVPTTEFGPGGCWEVIG